MGSLIRAYCADDRAAVREICCDTADKGGAVESFFPDRDLFADLVTAYYTDCEPQSSYVAEVDGKVVGYLNGTCDEGRRRLLTAVMVVPRAVLRALLRGTLWRWEVLRFACNNLLYRAPGKIAPFPAQLHVNLRGRHRGLGLGRALVEAFLGQLRQLHVHGVYASVREDNQAARAFFEGLGFRPYSRAPLMRHGDGRLLFRVVYGKEV